MKILMTYICLLFIIFNFAGCKTYSKREYSLDEFVAAEISKIENISSYSDETIKVLSVIYRENLSENNNSIISFIDPYILTLTKQTNNFKLNRKLVINTHLESWSEIINKAEILEYFKSKNISLANASEIKILSNENNFAEFISIASNEIDFIEFAKYFRLASNKDINVENHSSYLKLYGYGNVFDYDLDLAEVEKLALDGLRFNKIIENLSN